MQMPFEVLFFLSLHAKGKSQNVKSDADEDEDDADDDGDLAELTVKVLGLGAGNKALRSAADGTETLLASALEDNGKDEGDAADEFNDSEDYTEQFHFFDFSVSYGKLLTTHRPTNMIPYLLLFCKSELRKKLKFAKFFCGVGLKAPRDRLRTSGSRTPCPSRGR